MLQSDSCLNETNALCDEIGKYCKTTKTYYPSGNYLDWEDKNLSSHGPGIACLISSGFFHDNNVSMWIIANCHISETTMDWIGEGIKTGLLNSSMNTLWWIYNEEFGDGAMSKFAGAIQPAQALPGGPLASLQELALSYCSIGDEGMKNFSSALDKGAIPSLQTLTLDFNKFGDDGMKAFSSALDKGAIPSLQTLRLSSNNISEDGMQAFSSALENGAIPSLQTLTIDSNNFGDEGMKAFSSALDNGAIPSLQTLTLGYNNFGDDGLEALTKSLSINCTENLTEISVGNRRQFSFNAFNAFCHIIKQRSIDDPDYQCV